MVSSLILLRSLRVSILKQLFFSISVNSGFGNTYLAAFAARQIFSHYSPRFQRIIVKYPTSTRGIIVLLKMPTKYREFFPILFVKTTDFQLVFNFDQMCTTVQLPYLESMVFNNYSSSPNGLWVNSPWGRRPSRLLTQSSNCFSKIQLIGQNYWEQKLAK